MNTIAAAIQRLESAVARRSDFGVGTSRSETVSLDGLQCTTVEGEWSTVSDLPGALGGDGTAPTPGVLLRAALGSCMAMSYRLRAARSGIELTSVHVTVETDSAIAGMLSTDASAPPGYSEIRYHVEIESPAGTDVVLRIIDEGDRLSPLLDAVTRATSAKRTTAIRSGTR
jgi:uncharacterized OsmC-like protein